MYDELRTYGSELTHPVDEEKEGANYGVVVQEVVNNIPISEALLPGSRKASAR